MYIVHQRRVHVVNTWYNVFQTENISFYGQTLGPKNVTVKNQK